MIDITRGSARERLDKDEVAQLDEARLLVRDDRRRRPFYFDGRFLAAADLVRDQDYFLTRQADLGRAGGAGVVTGLQVELGSSATSLRILPGHGITPQGEMVVLRQPVNVDMVDVPKIQRLDSLFGLTNEPRRPIRNPTGLFIVALRPVEFFSTTSVTAYPTNITGERTLEPDEIVEAAAITLIPYADGRTTAELIQRRAQVAADIFVNDGESRLPTVALPLAMVGLDRGFVRWIDTYMVRREVGADHGDVLGMGFAPRAQREAHLRQYDSHLREILDSFAGGTVEPFAAATYFQALPPAGRLPAAAINTNDFTQTYFPPEMDVELSFVPDDELVALLEESLLLPPIDLTLAGESLESTSVLVLLPVPRQNVRRLSQTLTSLQRQLQSSAPNLVARRRPLEALRYLKVRRPLLPVVNTEELINSEWRDALTGLETLWYVRRRNLQYKAAVVGISVRVVGDDIDEEALFTRLGEYQLVTRFRNLQTAASAEANLEMVAMLSAPKFAISRLIMNGALFELEALEALEQKTVLLVAERFADPLLGAGIERLTQLLPDQFADRAITEPIAAAMIVPELDRLARTVINSDQLTEIGLKLVEIAGGGSTEEIAAFVLEVLKSGGG